MKQANLAALAAFLMATGCTVIGPDYEAPDRAAMAAGGFINAAGYETAEPLASWWTLFSDETLTSLVASGLSENRTLGAAFANVNAARAQWGLARLNRLPFDTVGASYLQNRQSSVLTGANFGIGGGEPFPTNEVSDLNVSASWEVDLFGRVTRTINAARADLGERQALLADLQALVAADIVDAYVNLRGLQEQLAVTQRNIENQSSVLALTEVIRDAGRGTDLDVELARAQLSSVRATAPALEGQIASVTYALGALTGKTPAEITAAVSAPAPLPRLEGVIAIGDPASLLRRRPDIAARERALASATENIGLNIVEAFPRIDLIGQGGYQAVGFQNQFSANALNFSAGPSVNWSLSNLLRARQRVKAACAGAEAAFNDYEAAILSALAETESTFATQARAQEQLVELTEAERASANAASLARLRYENGATNFLSVLDADRRDIEAADRLAAARTATVRAQVAVFRVLRAGPQAPAQPVSSAPGAVDISSAEKND
jgi:multidrug efflux system outer membrane protein